jgi:hypothetical protein
MRSGPKGKVTFRIAAVFFLLSAFLEIIVINSKVPLCGAMRGGVSAAVYHLIYFLLFLGLGIGLWRAKPWGYKLVFGATIFYTLEKVSALFYREFIKALLIQQLSRYEDILELIDIDLVLKLSTLMMLILVACWWGFAVYAYLRREYFGLGQRPELSAPQNRNRV